MLGGEIGDSWWALCCTGMLPDEFFSGKWAVEDGRVHFKGTKREARDRFVPLLTELRPSAMTKQSFERASGVRVGRASERRARQLCAVV